MNEEEQQNTPNESFKISQENEAYTLWTWREKWLPVYRFNPEHVEILDLDICNWYLATHPESNFRKNLVFSKVDPLARYTFSDRTLNIRKKTGGKESVSIENDVQLFQMLKDVFGLKENAIELLKQKG